LSCCLSVRLLQGSFIKLLAFKKGKYKQIRERGLKNKRLLFSRSEPLDTSPAAGEVLQTASDNTGETDSTAILKSNKRSVNDNNSTVNNEESYNQIIGEQGARQLDAQEGTTNRMDNLEVAKQMTEAGKDSKTIWQATGWERGKEGKWRYEIPDGRLTEKFKADNQELKREFDEAINSIRFNSLSALFLLEP